MVKENQRDSACCFTGHRPEKLTIPEGKMALLLEREIRTAIDRQFTTFLTGMAKGSDIVAAEIVLRLREKNPCLKLICALPYPNFGQHWGSRWTERFQYILSKADFVECICPSFSYAAYQKRNEWMVDHSSLVIAVFGGEKGGTKNTLDYAGRKNVPCIIIDG